MNKNGNLVAEFVSLDTFLLEEPITFIKMDIEGSELAALKGAQSIITEQKPKLAVCLYHKLEDILEITDFILEAWQGGQFYMRAEKDNVDQQFLLYAIY